jgi:hypothetical protein
MWVLTVLTSEFFWGVIVGLFLSTIGSYFLAKFTADQQRRERKEVLKNFSADTVNNIRQIVDDMNDLRNKMKVIHNDYLALLDVEINVFGRNREQLIYLPPELRTRIRTHVTDCALRRAEIGNYLSAFSNQWNQADQLFREGNGAEAQRIRDQANAGPLTAANKALDALVLRAKDSSALVSDIVSA